MDDLSHEGLLEPEILEGEDKKAAWKSVVREVVETLILAAMMFFVINAVTARIRVDGRSMEPSFYHGDYVLVNRLSYSLGEMSRGDVVVFPFPKNPEEDFIKRIIGLPGDTIKIEKGIVYINNISIDEPYISELPRRDIPETAVPENMVYVVGDNRNDSSDSRSWGPISIDTIVGKAVFVYWPLDEFGVVDHPQLIAP